MSSPYILVPRSRPYSSSAPSTSARTYQTDFPGVENPLSEGGVWLNGKTDGVTFADFEKNNGKAWGQQTLALADGTATLKAPWRQNHYAQGTIYVTSFPEGYSAEIELRLRTTITASSITGYEINFGAGGGFGVIRWNGPWMDFTSLYSGDIGGGIPTDGAVIYADVVGNILTVKYNGNVRGTYDLSAGGIFMYTNGSPGIGHNAAGDGSLNDQYGFTHFECGDL